MVLPFFAFANAKVEAPIEEEKAEEITKQNEQTATSTSVKAQPKVDINAVMLAIGKCESGNRQFNTDGTVLRGKVNPMDVGEFQINEKYHLADSKRLGYDIYTQEGNRGYAMYLYKTQGVKPWRYSAPCHGYY